MFVFGRREATLLLFLAIWAIAYFVINNTMLWLLFIPLSMVIVRTLRSWYFKEDVFAHDADDCLIDKTGLNDDEVMEHRCLPVQIDEFKFNHWFPTLITQPHSCQPLIWHSNNGKWKAPVTHTSWHLVPGPMIKHRFTIKYEPVH